MEETQLNEQRPAAVIAGIDRAAALREAIEREYPSLRQGVAVRILRMNLPYRGNLDDMADEVLHDAVLRAMAKADEFDPALQARPWLMRFAHFVLLRRREQAFGQQEPRSLDAPIGLGADADADYTLAERLLDPTAFAETRVEELLSLVDPPDREVLRLGFVEGLRGPAIARRLGINEAAARARHSRAIKRLAAAYRAAEQDADTGRRS